jgi:thiol-disulfide isomerase/thioredoxin
VRAEDYFKHQELDYWNEAKAKRAADAARDEEKPLRPLDAGEFRWEDYEDPSKDVFWDDGGNYIPPRPLRVAASDPTPANVARYLRWQKRKLEVIGTLNREMSRQLGEEPPPPTAAALARGLAGETAIAPAQAAAIRQAGPPIDWRRVELVFFYSSDCPHCQASLQTVQELESLGAKVIPVQMDWRERPALIPGSVNYTAEIAREQPVDAVPTWVAAYRGDRLTMQGEVTMQSIETTLKMAQQQKAQGRPQHNPGG